ncbi:2Fe-2S iron-sulfur cluster-binding protein [Mycobacterium sp. pW049]|uniref:2Fe-2S iron-sulfur cluster-binding protein n=1 Tax=[Mycobacterium] bulgaricum TaxID=3238985 RepID=UPI00351B2CC3
MPTADAAVGPRGARQLHVRRVIAETDDAASFALEMPDDESFRYRPGQYLTVQVPSSQTGSVARCYSLASSPHEDAELIVTVKRTDSGYASNWLCDNVSAGDTLTVLPPSGRFTPASFDNDLLLFAGGSGITPVYSIARSALSQGKATITLFYANRHERSVIFARAIDELARAHPERLEVVHWLESVQGIPDRGAVRELARRRPGRQAFICGPGPFMSGVAAALEESGMSHKNIHREVFTSLSGNPFEESTEPEPTVDEPGTEGGVLTEVDLDGQTHVVDWPRGKTLVDVLLAKDIDVPYMCKDGECGSCQATIEQGSATMLRNDILDEEDIADGYLLTCQAVPQGDDPIRIVF